MSEQPAEFRVSCECGRSSSVNEWDAGVRWDCDCGRQVTVPSLAELRKSVGLTEVPRSAAEIVHSLVNEGLLPPAECISCHGAADDVIPLIAICERTYSSKSFVGDVTDAHILSLIIPGLHRLINREQETQILGRNVAVSVPVRLCYGCRHKLPNALVSKAIRGLKYLTGLGGIAALLHEPWRPLALIMLPLAVLFQILEWIAVAWHHSAYRRVVGVVPEYKQLFSQYPYAIVGQFSPDLLKEW